MREPFQCFPSYPPENRIENRRPARSIRDINRELNAEVEAIVDEADRFEIVEDAVEVLDDEPDVPTVADPRNVIIERHFQDDRYPRKVLAVGVTRAQAERWCNHPETSSATCEATEGLAVTAQFGAWFDGFRTLR